MRSECRKRKNSRVARISEMWVNAANVKNLGHAQLCWCVYGVFRWWWRELTWIFVAFILFENRLMGWDGGWVLFLGWWFFFRSFFCRWVNRRSSFIVLSADGAWTRMSLNPNGGIYVSWHKLTDAGPPLNTSPNTIKILTHATTESRSSSYTFSQKVRIAIFFLLFRESYKLKFLIFSRYFLVQDWLAISAVRSRGSVEDFFPLT